MDPSNSVIKRLWCNKYWKELKKTLLFLNHNKCFLWRNSKNNIMWIPPSYLEIWLNPDLKLLVCLISQPAVIIGYHKKKSFIGYQ